MSGALCSVEGCGRTAVTRGMCRMHYARARRADPSRPRCAQAGCRHAVHARGWCQGHYLKHEADRLKARPSRDGYIMKGTQLAHVLIAEKVLGRKLPEGALVHHVNGDKADNRNANLVICPDEAYHNLIHMRMRALAATGDANSLYCNKCKLWGSPDVFHRLRNGVARHKPGLCARGMREPQRTKRPDTVPENQGKLF